MRSIIATVTLLSLSTTVQAEPVLSFDRFQQDASQIGQVAMTSAMWVRTLPIMAKDCGFLIDGDRLAFVMQHFGFVNFEGRELSILDRGKAENEMKQDWSTMVSSIRDRACDTAKGLWGQKGTSPQFGVLE